MTAGCGDRTLCRWFETSMRPHNEVQSVDASWRSLRGTRQCLYGVPCVKLPLNKYIVLS